MALCTAAAFRAGNEFPKAARSRGHATTKEVSLQTAKHMVCVCAHCFFLCIQDKNHKKVERTND